MDSGSLGETNVVRTLTRIVMGDVYGANIPTDARTMTICTGCDNLWYVGDGDVQRSETLHNIWLADISKRN